MKILISVLILAVFAYGGWELWQYWDRVQQGQDDLSKQAAVPQSGDQLSGMPNGMQASYDAAVKAGPAAVKNWLQHYGQSVQDPRRAWIELDYMISIAHDQPAEARKIFAEIKARVPESSSVYPRIKQLEPTYQ